MRTILWSGLVLTAALSAEAQEDPLAVSITAKAVPLDAAQLSEAKGKAAQFMVQYMELDKQLRKQYGGKREKWPAEERARLAKLNEGEFRSRFEANYSHGAGLDVAGVGEVAQQMAKSLGGKPTLRSASSPEEADLSVDVLGCIAEGSNGDLGVRVSPGGRLDAAALGANPPDWGRVGADGGPPTRSGPVKSGGSWWSVQHKPFTPEEGFWLVSTSHPGISRDMPKTCTAAGVKLVDALEAFVTENRAALLPARKAPRP